MAATLTGAVSSLAISNIVLTGNPQSPTPTAGDNSTNIATTAFVATAISGISTSSSGVYDVGGYIEGLTINAETPWIFVSPRSWTLPSGASGVAVSTVAATASTTYTLTLSTSSTTTTLGTIVFAVGATIGVVSLTATTSIVSGNVLKLVGPATADTTLANVAFTFTGTRP